MRRKKLVALLFVLVLVFMQACTSKEPIPKEKVTLKVWAWDGNYNAFAAEFMAKHPNIILQYVEAYDLAHIFKEIDDAETFMQEYIAALDKAQPDVILISQYYTYLASSGRLASLETMIEGEDFHKDTYSPELLDMLRTAGGGTLYALATGFHNRALFYNKTLLQQHQIDVPSTGLTWNELLNSAELLTTGKGKDDTHGYFVGTGEQPLNKWGLISNIGLSYGLKYVNMESKKATLNTEGWADIWKMVLNGYKSGAMYEHIAKWPINAATGQPEWNYEISFAPFLSGTAAFASGSVGTLYELKQRTVPFEWGVVPEPVAPKEGKGVSMQPGEVYAINAATDHKEEAWELLAYLTGEERAKQLAAIDGNRGLLPARTNTVKSSDPELAPFYALPPSPYGVFHELNNAIPPKLIEKVANTANQLFVELLEDKLTIDKALQKLQDETQVELNAL